jgi:cell division protein FtsW
VTIGLVAALLLAGLVMVTSASMSIAARDLGNPFFYLQRQFVYGGLGVLIAWVVTRIPTQLWEKYSTPLLFIGLGLLLLVLVPGIGAVVNGARRWLRVGPVNFQVSELARVLVLTWICAYCVRKRAVLEKTWGGLLTPVAPLGLAAILLLVEPDFGATTVLVATGCAILFIGGARLRYVIALVAAAVCFLAVMIAISPYRRARLLSFMHPFDDRYASGFQLTQSLIAIGRGSWFGVGLGSGVQKLFYLPEAHTDFVFAVLAEELGLIGVVGLILLFVALVWRSFRIARMASAAGLQFQAYLALAFGIWIGAQAIVNIGVNMGLLPTKGLTLPLLSYGRSSLLVTLAWIGVLLRIYHEVKCTSRSAVIRGSGGAA